MLSTSSPTSPLQGPPSLYGKATLQRISLFNRPLLTEMFCLFETATVSHRELPFFCKEDMPNISQTCSVFSELTEKHDIAKAVLWYESHSVKKKKSLLQTIPFTEVANLLKPSRSWGPHLHARILQRHSQTQGKWWTPVEFWSCTHDLYLVLKVQHSVSLTVSAGRFSSWFFCCCSSQKYFP